MAATTTPTVGVLAVQGAFALHVDALSRCGLAPVEVRRPEQLDGVDALIMPGGESTTMVKLMTAFELVEPLAKRLADGMPVFGTCAGMILLASRVLDGQPDQLCLGAIDLDVRRNGYGRQINSFEADLDVPAVGPSPVRAVFIRAPVVDRIGPGVEVLAEVDGLAVLCRQGPVMVSSFHPELSGDDRLHQLFVSSILR